MCYSNLFSRSPLSGLLVGFVAKRICFFKVSEFILRHFENGGANNAFNKIMFNLLKYNLVSGILSMYVLGYYDR